MVKRYQPTTVAEKNVRFLIRSSSEGDISASPERYYFANTKTTFRNILINFYCRVSLMDRLRDWLRASGMFFTGERSYSVEDMEARSVSLK
jgi:hypothetical protein